MGMMVSQRLVLVFVDVRLAAVPTGLVRVLVVCVVRMQMRMDQQLVLVLVLMRLGEMQPNTDRHECAGYPEWPPDLLSVQE